MDIRFQVFVEGQGVPFEEEIDGKDAQSVHYLLDVDNHAAGVARVRNLNECAKIISSIISEQSSGCLLYLSCGVTVHPATVARKERSGLRGTLD